MANILHLTHRYAPVIGGSEHYLQQIAKRQFRDGHHVTVVTTNADDLAYFWDPRASSLTEGEIDLDGIRTIRVPVAHLPGTPQTFGAIRHLEVNLSRVPSLSSLAGSLARWAPYLPELASTLEALGTSWNYVFGWNITFDGLMESAKKVAAKSGGRFVSVPFVHLGEGVESPVRRFYTMPHQIGLLSEADCVVVQTQFEEDYLASQGIAKDRLVIAGGGIDPEALAGGDGAAFCQQHDVEGPVVAFIGPLTFDKGAIHLLEAARRLWLEDRPFTLVLAGPMMDDFRRCWEQLEPHERDRIRYLGIISEEKPDLLAAMDILVLPSRTDSFGIVFLEAWFYAKPVVGISTGAIADVVNDGVDGRLVDFGDVASLADAIEEILTHPARADSWGQNGKRKTINYFTWDKVYERISKAILKSDGVQPV